MDELTTGVKPVDEMLGLREENARLAVRVEALQAQLLTVVSELGVCRAALNGALARSTRRRFRMSRRPTEDL